MLKNFITAIKNMRKTLSDLGIKKTKTNRIKILINLFLFKKIPYVEVVLTTRCTLRCRDCANYIPDIKSDKQYSMTFEQYKSYLDNLLANIKRIHKLVILGGEPLLVKDLDKILEYSLSHPKVRKVKLVTNGTLDVSENLIKIIRPYAKRLFPKIRFFISNYSINTEIAGRLKIEAISAKLKSFGISVSSARTTTWYPVSPIKLYSICAKQNRKKFLSCPYQCVSLTGSELFVCPRAGVFKLHDVCEQEKGREFLDLSKPVAFTDFLAFYSNVDFTACGYCNMTGDVAQAVLPAIQKQ